VIKSPDFNDLRHKDISLIQVSKEMDLTKAMLIVLKRMLADRSTPFLLLSNSTSKDLIRVAQESSIDLVTPINQKRLVVVDCVSKYKEEGIEELKNIYYAASPSDLSGVALKVSEAVSDSRNVGEKWLVIDSLSAMSMYNTAGGILRFMQFLFKKLRMLHFDGTVVVARDGSEDPLLNELRRYCNTIIFLTN
jgi:archaellum biogenesis ATPase FlaH